MRGFIVGKPRLNQMMLAVLGAGIAVSAAGPGASAAGGDPSAKAEVVAAFKRLNALPGYRIKVAGHDSAGVVTTGVLEVVPPDKIHWTLRSPQGDVEFFSVGKESRTRFTTPGQPGGWQCTSSENRPTPLFDVDKMSKDRAAVIRRPDTVIDGTPVHVYVDASNPGSGDVLYIGTKTGLPRRWVDGDKESGGTLDFYDYGAKIAITLPACK